MTSVEEIIDEIRAHFAPSDVVDITKRSPLAVKLRLLSYQLGKDAKPDAKAYADDWYHCEAAKFHHKPGRIREEPVNAKHPLHEAWEEQQKRREHQRAAKQRERHTRAVRDEFVDELDKADALDEYMEKITKHIQEGTSWQAPPDVEPEVELAQRLEERRQRHYTSVKKQAEVAQQKLQETEMRLAPLEDDLEKRRAERRARLEHERQERERQLKEQEEYRNRRNKAREERLARQAIEDKEREREEEERAERRRQRQAEQTAAREAEFARREREWAEFEEEERQRREEERVEREKERAELLKQRAERDAILAKEEEERKAHEEKEIAEYVKTERKKENQAKENAKLVVGETLKRGRVESVGENAQENKAPHDIHEETERTHEEVKDIKEDLVQGNKADEEEEKSEDVVAVEQKPAPKKRKGKGKKQQQKKENVQKEVESEGRTSAAADTSPAVADNETAPFEAVVSAEQPKEEPKAEDATQVVAPLEEIVAPQSETEVAPKEEVVGEVETPSVQEPLVQEANDTTAIPLDIKPDDSAPSAQEASEAVSVAPQGAMETPAQPAEVEAPTPAASDAPSPSVQEEVAPLESTSEQVEEPSTEPPASPETPTAPATEAAPEGAQEAPPALTEAQ